MDNNHFAFAYLVPGEHNGLNPRQGRECPRGHDPQLVVGEPDIQQVFVHVLVEQIVRDARQLIGLKVEILQLPLVVEGGLADLLDLVVVQTEPEQLLKRLDRALGKRLGLQPKGNLQRFQTGSDFSERFGIDDLEGVEGEGELTELGTATEDVWREDAE